MNLTQLKTSNALASHLRYPKRKFAEAVEQSLKEHDMVCFDLSCFEHHNNLGSFKDTLFYCSSQTEKNLSNLWDWQKFLATGVGGEFLDMQNNIEKTFVFTYAFNSSVFAITESEYYAGLGGIFVRKATERSGIVIEPFNNFLKANLLLPEID
jgi:hypothetical protein